MMGDDDSDEEALVFKKRPSTSPLPPPKPAAAGPSLALAKPAIPAKVQPKKPPPPAASSGVRNGTQQPRPASDKSAAAAAAKKPGAVPAKPATGATPGKNAPAGNKPSAPKPASAAGGAVPAKPAVQPKLADGQVRQQNSNSSMKPGSNAAAVPKAASSNPAKPSVPGGAKPVPAGKEAGKAAPTVKTGVKLPVAGSKASQAPGSAPAAKPTALKAGDGKPEVKARTGGEGRAEDRRPMGASASGERPVSAQPIERLAKAEHVEHPVKAESVEWSVKAEHTSPSPADGAGRGENGKAAADAADSDDSDDDDLPLGQRAAAQAKPDAAPSERGGAEDRKPAQSEPPGKGLAAPVSKKRSAPPPAPAAEEPAGDARAIAKKSRSSEEPEADSPPDESDSDSDDVPLSQRVPVVPTSAKRKASSVAASNGKKAKKVTVVTRKEVAVSVKKKKENGAAGGGDAKWTTLEHNGVIFPPPYTPHGVKLLYNGKPVDLTPVQEEVATMFAVMRETEYFQKAVFVNNFWSDWKELLGPKHVIKSLENCDFTPIWEWHVAEKEKKKAMTSEEKKALKEEKALQEEKYAYAVVDGVREKVGNFRVEPPGLFRGRGEHPKMGKLKKRIFPEHITINVGKDAPVVECPMPGHHWKEVRHDPTVTWLAYWNDPINPRESKYVFLAPSSNLKGQSDKEKYEKARKLKGYIGNIRRQYTKNFKSDDEQERQIAVATYLIDRLALRAGNEKDDDEADTVGCCSLKVEHIKLIPPSSLQFDFLGKDSIRYFNTVEVEPLVYKAVGQFCKGKKGDADLFDKLDTSKVNAYLKEIMPGLTAKVFRTYNASVTLDDLLQGTSGQTVAEKVADYQRANKEVAILCNHQRSVSKGHSGQIERLQEKMAELSAVVKEMEEDLERVRAGKTPLQRKDADGKVKRAQSEEQLVNKLRTYEERLSRMQLDMKVKEDLKTVALGTSKINYMDPRITIAWCKLHEVPLEKVFNKSLVAKFVWAMDVEPEYRF